MRAACARRPRGTAKPSMRRSAYQNSSPGASRVTRPASCCCDAVQCSSDLVFGIGIRRGFTVTFFYTVYIPTFQHQSSKRARASASAATRSCMAAHASRGSGRPWPACGGSRGDSVARACVGALQERRGERRPRVDVVCARRARLSRKSARRAARASIKFPKPRSISIKCMGARGLAAEIAAARTDKVDAPRLIPRAARAAAGRGAPARVSRSRRAETVILVRDRRSV